jgi:hypothetical protein
MQKSEMPGIYLCLESNCLANFFYLLQSGFRLKIKVGMNVEATLTQEFGLDSGLLEKIQTVFLDGKAVDDLDSSVVREGSILALSAAMPGLVGATLRRGSYYAAMRSQITAAETHDTGVSKEGMVKVKLFNLLMSELAPIFLGKGIWIEKSVLQDFFAARPANFWASCEEARINGSKVEPEAVAKWQWPEADELIFLKVATTDPKASTCSE